MAAACYLNILPNDYCYDDVPIVQKNPLVQAQGHWAEIWTSDYWGLTPAAWPSRDLLYRPVSITSYRLVRWLAGPATWPQHAVNIALHALASALVLLLGRCLGLRTAAALAAGLIFALMPIHSEAVAGIVGRADLGATVCTMTALLAHASARGTTKKSARLTLYFITAIVAFLAAGFKESGLAVFPMLVLWDLLLTLGRSTGPTVTASAPTAPCQADAQRDRTSAMLREPGRPSVTGALARCSYILIPLSVYLALRYNALDGQLISQPQLTKTINVLVDAPPALRALGVAQAWGMYWAKTFWPQPLCINYSINAVRLATSFFNPHVLMGTAAALALAAVSVWAMIRRRGLLLFVPVALVLTYLPTSNALKLIQVFFAERTWYLPSAFAAILLAWIVSPLLSLRVFKIIGGLVFIAAGAHIWDRSYDWRNNGTLFAAAYAAHPDGVQPLHLYGSWLARHGRLEEGIALLEKAVTIDPGYTDAHRALSQAYLVAKQPAEAIEHTQAAEMQVPGDEATKLAHQQAAAALEQENRGALNEAYLAATKNPADLNAHLQLERLLRDLGRVEESIQLMMANESRFADRAIWHAELAVNFVLLNRIDEAISHYRQSLRLEENAQAAVELAMLLLERRRPEDLAEADRLSSLALNLAPQAPHALVCRAEVLAQQGDLSAAESLYRRAIESTSPADPRRRQFIERSKALGLSLSD